MQTRPSQGAVQPTHTHGCAQGTGPPILASCWSLEWGHQGHWAWVPRGEGRSSGRWSRPLV